MNLIIGFIIVIGSVAGGFVLSHGDLRALWQPFEVLIIGGAAFGAFVVANPTKVIKAVGSGTTGLFKASNYGKPYYLSLMSFLYKLFVKARKQGLMAVENDVEEPESSEIFAEHPEIMQDETIRIFIADSMRLVISGGVDPFQLDNLLSLEIETRAEEAKIPAAAVYKVADALPGFGIVAAVLGIVITMSYIGGTPEEIGQHVAAALVGTFLGILMAYGFVAPVSTAMEKRAMEQIRILEVIKACLLANQQGYTPQVAVEFGRKIMPTHIRPDFNELEGVLKGRTE